MTLKKSGRSSETVVVYRYENSDGWGPYQGGDGEGRLQEMYWDHGGNSNNPVPHKDGILKITQKMYAWRHGCESLESLQAWFKGYEELLKDAGFFIVAYRVPKKDVAFGNKQVLFDIENAKLLKKDHDE